MLLPPKRPDKENQQAESCNVQEMLDIMRMRSQEEEFVIASQNQAEQELKHLEYPVDQASEHDKRR